jgi:hypothetical protein
MAGPFLLNITTMGEFDWAVWLAAAIVFPLMVLLETYSKKMAA